ncbi:MAG: hypothetical protein EKK53_07180 [Burkholderiales bacterium]|nr:MAG: hypothetical protein EKK53_07180 [Burkholderiales bacterium]
MTVSPTRRRFLAASSWLAAIAASTPAVAAPRARIGTHGMVLFGGREGLYGSHMPMFHAPHDVQVLLRLAPVKQRLSLALRRALHSAPGRLWTIHPERFDLDRLAPGAPDPLTEFDARVFQGHFERGGRVAFEGVRFRVEQVPVYAPLNATPRHAPRQRFWCLGDGTERFLVKQLDQRPDVDLIGSFQTAVPVPGQPVLDLPNRRLATPDPQALNAALAQAGFRPLHAVHWHYAETGDLA